MNRAAVTLPRESQVPTCGWPARNARLTGLGFKVLSPQYRQNRVGTGPAVSSVLIPFLRVCQDRAGKAREQHDVLSAPELVDAPSRERQLHDFFLENFMRLWSTANHR
jgi:hypothetical protein